jgi:hypothetical protein
MQSKHIPVFLAAFAAATVLVATLELVPVAASDSVFRYDDFNNVEHLNVLNDAFRTGNRLRLTRAASYQNGTANYESAIFLRDGFDTSFTFAISARDSSFGGADGLAFIIQTAGAAEAGPQVGYIPYGIPGAVVVELDTWMNGNLGDPNDNHISLQAVGPNPDGSSEFDQANSLGSTMSIPNLSDGAIHRVDIQYRPGRLEVYVDQSTTPNLSVAVDLTDFNDSTALDADGYAFVGLAAGTGAGYESHDILSWSLELPSPKLSIVRSGQNLLIAWPASRAGYILQSATTLDSGIDWQPVPESPTIIEDQQVVSAGVNEPSRFFRLRKL